MGKIGRPRGSLNKNTIPVAMRCEALGADPVAVLCEALKNPDEKFRAAEALMPYIYPKLKSLEFTVADIPDEIFEKEAERRVNLKIVRGETDRDGKKIG